SGLSPLACLVLCSPLYFSRPPDWPAHFELTGFAHWDDPAAWSGHEELDDFLAAGEPPLVVTLGASLSLDPQGFFDAASDAIAALGRRALFLVGRDANLRVRGRAERKVVRFAPLSRVLPRSCAIIHHGGFGTTATALRCGRPALVVPRAFDQAF